eukprot:CAMPEP_0182417306 /NCGR_PEP_ID=MMETSP1167-20130531/1738_1 /TAXON_ID=2988 /ORGANISM="Mallomonas Sp, Strain CCMP3275" /LENGTH=221 /DNA_ID=CAMNT_0024590747 /DNA_START=71 /DNA_END=736 /DNA_ORIENTATION=-
MNFVADKNKLALHYFPLRAKAEPTRMILAVGGIDHQFIQIPLSDWGDVKPTMPLGQLPVLTLPSGTIIAESGAIARYCARLGNLYPDDLEEIAKAEMLFELHKNMSAIDPILNFYEYKSEAWQGAYDKYFNELPSNLAVAQKMLGDRQFFGGDKPHFGEIAMFHTLFNTVDVCPTSLDAFPLLKAWFDRLKAVPAMAKYLEERPNVNTPGFGKSDSMMLSR